MSILLNFSQEKAGKLVLHFHDVSSKSGLTFWGHLLGTFKQPCYKWYFKAHLIEDAAISDFFASFTNSYFLLILQLVRLLFLKFYKQFTTVANTQTHLLIGWACCLGNDHGDIITSSLEHWDGVMVVRIHQALSVNLHHIATGWGLNYATLYRVLKTHTVVLTLNNSFNCVNW